MERGDSPKLRSIGKLRIPKPTRHAYINFVQDFRQSYKGAPKTSSQMVALAAQEWRGMGERERAPYEAVAAEERLKPRPQTTTRRRGRVDRLRSQLRLLKEQVAGLKTTAKQLQMKSRQKRTLRQRVQKRAASKPARRGNKRPTGKRQVKKTRRVARRPHQVRRQTSYTSRSSSSCSSS